MTSRLALGAIVLALAAFGVGVFVGSLGLIGVRPPLMLGDGYAGERQVSITVGDTVYGASDSVAWRDAGGSEHMDGWPDCLHPGTVSRIPIRAAVVWSDNVGQAQILWVDCSGRT